MTAERQGFTRLAIYGPRDRKLTTDEAKKLVTERINAWVKLSGEKFVTGQNYGLGYPGSYNMYYAYFERSLNRVHVSEAWSDSAFTLMREDDHGLRD